MSTLEHIAAQALALPPADRVYLANILEESLTAGGFGTSELAAEWTAEIDRRVAAYARGETVAIEADAALERIRERLIEHRARRALS